MRKKIIDQDQQTAAPGGMNWLDVEHLAQVEVTSEDAAFPIENALAIGNQSGWRASSNGMQIIRIIFDEPQHINHILLHFEEKQQTRTQEFVLRWSADHGNSYQEAVRQQYNFSPGSSSQELEDYSVNLRNVNTIELLITPEIGGGNAYASIKQLRFA